MVSDARRSPAAHLHCASLWRATAALSLSVLLLATAPAASEMICAAPGDCYPKAFEATSEFRDVREGQVLPQGLHVKVDLTTGLKQAKLVHDADKPQVQNSLAVVLKGDDIVTSPSNSPEREPPVSAPVGFPVGSTAATVAELEVSRGLSRTSAEGIARKLGYSPGDHQTYHAHVQQIVQWKTKDSPSDEKLTETLKALAEMVHDREFGLKLAEGEGFEAVLFSLDHPNWKVRKASALVVGNAAQNNPPVQVVALKANLAEKLLRALEVEPEPSVAREQLFALAALVRGNHGTRMFFLNVVRGLAIMGDIWTKKADDISMRKKLVVFVTDLLDASMDPEAPASPPEEPSGPKFHKELLSMQDAAQTVFGGPPDSTLRDRDVAVWCDLLSRAILTDGERLDLDMREKLVLGVEMLYHSSPTACPADTPLRQWLLAENARVASNADFEEYAALVLRAAELPGLKHDGVPSPVD